MTVREAVGKTGGLPAGWAWTLTLSAVMCALCALGGAAGIVAALVLLPLGVEWLRAQGGPTAGTLAALAACAGCAISLNGTAELLAMVWCAAAAGLVWLPVRRTAYRGLMWGAAALLMGCGVVAACLRMTEGHLMTGLAERIVQLIGESSRCDEILLGAYQAGYVGLEGKLALLPALRVGSLTVMTQEVRLQLLYGLRTTVEYALESLIPQLMVMLPAVTALLCAAVPDRWLKRRGKCEDPLPDFDKWFMPRGMGLRVGCLSAGFVVPYLTQSAPIVYFALMCSAAFTAAYMLQGASTLAFVQKKGGMAPGTRWIWLMVILLIFPPALTILGVMDQVTVLRGLRETNEREDL